MGRELENAACSGERQRSARENRNLTPHARWSGFGLCLFGFHAFLNFHILKLFRIENLAAFQAFDKFRVFVPRYDANSRMLAYGGHNF